MNFNSSRIRRTNNRILTSVSIVWKYLVSFDAALDFAVERFFELGHGIPHHVQLAFLGFPPAPRFFLHMPLEILKAVLEDAELARGGVLCRVRHFEVLLVQYDEYEF